MTAGFKTSGDVEVDNNSGVAVNEASVTIQASPFAFSLQKKESNIPPFAKIKYPLTLTINSFITRGTGQINATVNGQTENFFFVVEPLYWLFVPLGVLLVGVLLLLWLFLVKLRVWKTRKSS